MTKSELIALVTEEVKGLSSQYVADDYSNAADDASRDCGWAFPQTSDFRIKWLKERMKRHLFSYLLDQSLYKFKYKNISLGDRWKHLTKRVADMDAAFEKIKEEEIHEFADVAAFNMFPTQIDSGFATENQTGRNITYDEDQKVIITPNEDS